MIGPCPRSAWFRRMLSEDRKCFGPATILSRPVFIMNANPDQSIRAVRLMCTFAMYSPPRRLQGHLIHKKAPTPLGPPQDPTPRRWGPRGVRFLVGQVPLYVRATPPWLGDGTGFANIPWITRDSIPLRSAGNMTKFAPQSTMWKAIPLLCIQKPKRKRTEPLQCRWSRGKCP